MRVPVNPLPPGSRQRISSVAVAFTVDAFETQPVDDAAVPVGRLDSVSGHLVDDAALPVQRTMTVNASTRTPWLRAGMWIRATVGIQVLQPIIYRMPTLIITDITEDLSRLGGATITAQDPAAVLNGRPYEADTTLTGTLRSLVAAACGNALTRPTNVSGVPTVAVPAATVAEFGAGSWDVCLGIGDSLGYALRFTDPGDVVATDRNATAPSPAATINRHLVEGGACHHVRIPTGARVLVTRGSDTIGLVGQANWADIATTPLPAWYLPFIITARQEGDATTTQAQADALARQLYRAQLSELEAYVGMPILPSPALEAGVDVVTFYGRPYYVRAVEFDFPSLATTVTLRAVSMP